MGGGGGAGGAGMRYFAGPSPTRPSRPARVAGAGRAQADGGRAGQLAGQAGPLVRMVLVTADRKAALGPAGGGGSTRVGGWLGGAGNFTAWGFRGFLASIVKNRFVSVLGLALSSGVSEECETRKGGPNEEGGSKHSHSV